MAKLPARIVAISFAPPERLMAYAAPEGVELYSDPDRRTYARYGFGRASWVRAYLDPRVWLAYARIGRLERPREDTLQLGGDAVFGPDGELRRLYRSTGPEDRPSPAELSRSL